MKSRYYSLGQKNSINSFQMMIKSAPVRERKLKIDFKQCNVDTTDESIQMKDL